MRQVRQDPLGKEVNPQPAASDEHSAQSSRGRLFRNNLILPDSTNGDSFERSSEGLDTRSVLPSTVQSTALVRGSSVEYGRLCHQT